MNIVADTLVTMLNACRIPPPAVVKCALAANNNVEYRMLMYEQWLRIFSRIDPLHRRTLFAADQEILVEQKISETQKERFAQKFAQSSLAADSRPNIAVSI